MPPLILASASPRRRELLELLDYPFTIVESHVDEVHEAHTSLRHLTQLNAAMKAAAVAQKHPESLVIGADTLVQVGGVALAKPADMAEARQMLEMLAGRQHEVCTAVSLQQAGVHRRLDFLESALVTFRKLSAAEITRYLELTSPLDKAGAYGIQDHGDLIVESVDGDLNTIIGLPVDRLRVELEAWEQLS
jgi:septum formation protein